MAGCALTALAATLPATAAADGLQATPNAVLGSPAITLGATTTDIVPDQAETVIDWRPFDTGTVGTIDILPTGSTLSFRDPTGALGDFTVLNRILPVDASGLAVARPIQFNGTVISRIVNNPGGHIWFYSPTGIIAGPGSVFDVGSLLLTTNDIGFVAGAGGSIYKPGGLVQFFGPAGSTGFVTIQPTATIDARGANAYVALVAPRVTQGGLVQANGQIAYLAAEQLEMTINGGLFDFTLTVGTTDPNGVVHTGSTTGPASTFAADTQQISMVALAKNAALTMLLSGSVGYTPAASAAVEGSSIVLAAGFANDSPNALPADRFGSISVADTVFRNALTAYATDTVALAPSTGLIDLQGDATIHAANRIDVVAQPSETVNAAGNLSLRAGAPGVGGIVDLRALGSGQIVVGGPFFVDATSEAANYDTLTPFLDGFGGTINVVADGGTISSAVLTQMDASGLARFGGALGGTGAGGTIDVLLEQGGVIATPELTLLARGQGGNSDGTGGDGLGGAINVFEIDGQLDVGILQAFSGGEGGNASLNGGDGTGGNINIEITGQAQNLDQLIVDASGAAGVSFGTGPSGIASALTDAIRLAVGGTGSLAVADLVSLTANAFSGYNGPAGFTGQAGGVLVLATDGAAFSTDVFEAFADAAFAGDLPAIDPDTTPIQQGGTVDVTADSGTISARVFTASADAYGHAALTSAGNATGGTTQVSSLNGGSITIRDPSLLTPGALLVSASGYGGIGPRAPDVSGGTARLIAQDGSIAVVGDAIVTASGSVGAFLSFPGGDGHNAYGGFASVELQAGALGTGSIAATNLYVLANGDARGDPKAGGGGGSPLLNIGGNVPPPGDAIIGNSGTGIGGTATVTIDAGTLAAGQLLVQASGIGGTSGAIDAPTAFQSGDGIGGISTLFLNGGTSTITSLALASDGLGGGGASAAGGSSTAALAGEGIGGIALAAYGAGILTATDTLIEALGTGGAGMSHDGTEAATDGGDGNGGLSLLQSTGGATGSFTTGTLAIRGSGTGGTGGTGGTAAIGADGNGGNGFGLSAGTDLADGAFSLGAVTIAAVGTGGSGAVGGTGTGGIAALALNDTAAGPSGARSMASLSVDSSGLGSGGSTSTPGLTNLEVNALDPTAAVTVAGGLTLTNLGANAPAGNGITATVSGAPLVAGGNIAMTTVRDLAINGGPGLQAAGTVTLDARSITTTGLVSAGGAMSVTGPNGITAAALTSGGTTLIQAVNGALTVANLNSVGAVTALARSIAIGSSGALSFADVDATAGNLSITTAGNLGLVTADATGAVTLSSTGGSIAATGAVNAGGATSATGQNGLSFTTLVSGGTTQLTAANGAVGVTALTSPGAVTALGRSVSIVSPGTLTFADLDATVGAAGVQTAGNLTLSTADATGALSLRSTGGNLLTTGAVNGGSVALIAGGAVQANANVVAAGALTVDAGGAFTLGATGRGATVTVTSNDIALGATAALGARGQTTALTLINRDPARTTFIGGAADPSGYSLDQAEAARLFADNSITIGVSLTGPPPPAGQGTIAIRDLALAFGGAPNNIGTGGRLEISTQGRISITGDVALATSSANDTFTLDPSRIELDTSTGSIAMLANGAPLGRLVMTGGTVAIATTAVLGQLATLTDLAAINALLNTPGGDPLALRAGTMTFNVATGLFIQNAGATELYRDRRGFTANGVAINTASGATPIAINGQILTATGPLLGLDTQTMVTINGVPAAAGGQFDPASTINGCLIGGFCAPPVGANPPSDPDLNGPIPTETGPGGLFGAPLIELAGSDPLIAPPLVDEPITGVGNDDLWQPRCDEDPDTDDCPEADGEE